MRFGDVLEETWPKVSVKWSTEAKSVFQDMIAALDMKGGDVVHLKKVMSNALLTYNPDRDILSTAGGSLNNWSITKAREYMRGLLANFNQVSGRADLQKRLERIFV